MPPAEPAEEPVGYGAITVRRFRESDSDAMAALTAETPEAAAWTRTSYARFPAQPGAVALVAEEQGSVVGFLIGRALEQQAEVLNLAVGWSKRRRGCATLLLAASILRSVNQIRAPSRSMQSTVSTRGACARATTALLTSPP